MKILDIQQSGKAGQYVSYRGRNGLIRRGYAVPRYTQTTRQMTVRSTLTQQAQAFKAMAAADQDAWNTAALRFHSRARVGQCGPLTGLQLFTKCNCLLALMGQDTVSTPPVAANPGQVHVTGVDITNVADVIAIKLTTDGNPGQNTIIRASAPQGAGVRTLPSMRLLGACPAPVANKADITALYVAEFGAVAVGERIFVQASVYDPNGLEGNRLNFTGLVPVSS